MEKSNQQEDKQDEHQIYMQQQYLHSSQFIDTDQNQQGNVGRQESNQALKHRIGDWVCCLCMNLNFAFRNICNRCHKSLNPFNQQRGLAFVQQQQPSPYVISTSLVLNMSPQHVPLFPQPAQVYPSYYNHCWYSQKFTQPPVFEGSSSSKLSLLTYNRIDQNKIQSNCVSFERNINQYDRNSTTDSPQILIQRDKNIEQQIIPQQLEKKKNSMTSFTPKKNKIFNPLSDSPIDKEAFEKIRRLFEMSSSQGKNQKEQNQKPRKLQMNLNSSLLLPSFSDNDYKQKQQLNRRINFDSRKENDDQN